MIPASSTSSLPSTMRQPAHTGTTPLVLLTDKNSLILKRAVVVNGEHYDLRINLYNGTVKRRFSDTDEFIPDVLERVREVAGALFQGCFATKPDGAQVFYNVDGKCVIRNLQTQEDGEVSGKSGVPIRSAMAQVLGAINGFTTSWSRNGAATISPRIIETQTATATTHQSGTQASVDASEGGSLEAALARGRQKEAFEEVPSHRADALPAPARGEAEEATADTESSPSISSLSAVHAAQASTPVTKDGARLIENLTQKFDTATQLNQTKLADFLQGITYSALGDYSMQAVKPEESNLKRPFEAFKKALKNPQSTDSDAQQMIKWLRILYAEAYNTYKSCVSLYAKDVQKGEKRDLTNWSKYYAAKAVACFIQANVDTQLLVTELQTTSV